MKILVTGTAGFIGYHVTKKLLELGHDVVGLDNINEYYDIKLKFARLNELGITQSNANPFNLICSGKIFGDRFRFIRMNIEDRENLPKIFKNENFDVVCNLAAQAGVRYSIENPEVYIDSNIVGFSNILECCRHNNIKHLVYASSSSVYGLNKQIPFSEDDKTDTPISIYAASKISNELMAHSYSHLFQLPTTGLRFFTVYGPWGRPDMALFLFTEAIIKNKPIKVFNSGEMERDFTYIDDITKGITMIVQEDYLRNRNNKKIYRLYNIGNNNAVRLLDFITEIELNLNKKAIKEFLPLQPGDVEKTWANVDSLIKDYDYKPKTAISKGIKNFVKWYVRYYRLTQ